MSKYIGNKRLFIFDAGNVTIKGIDFATELCSVYGIDLDEFWRDYEHYEFPMYEGLVTEDMYLRHLEKKFKVVFNGNPIKEYFHPEMNEEMITIIDKLREKGYRVVMGSNTINDHTEVMINMGVTDHFDALYLSDRIRLSKPDHQFFEYILKHEGVSAEDAFFTDDRIDYIEGAIGTGIDTLHYTGDDKSEKLHSTYSFLFD